MPEEDQSKSAPNRPEIEAYALGPFATNCYVVTPEEGGVCWIVDASFEPGQLIEHVRRAGLTPQAVVLTHAHVDHIAGLDDVRRAFPGVAVWIHEAEASWLGNSALNLSDALGMPVRTGEADRMLNDGDEIALGTSVWQVMHTPGHSPGGITLYHAPSRQAIVGDSLFAGSIGRTDFPGSDIDTLVDSIRNRLYRLEPQTTIYPGHGPTSTIGRERRSNPFVHD